MILISLKSANRASQFIKLWKNYIFKKIRGIKCKKFIYKFWITAFERSKNH